MNNQVPTYPKFRDILISDKAYIDKLMDSNYLFSEVIFSNLYCWRMNGLKTRLSLVGDELVIKSCDVARGGYNLILLSDDYRDIKKILRENIFNHKKNFSHVLIPTAAVKYLDDEFEVLEDHVNHEYIYSVDDLASLKGNKYGVTRANVNKFNRNYPECKIVIHQKFTKKNSAKSLVNELFHKWTTYKNGTHTTAGIYELEALNYLLMHAKLYDLRIVSIMDNNHLVAFATVEIAKNRKIAYVCFAKSDHAYKGSSETLIHNVAKYLDSLNVKQINFEQDLGLESLRNYKLKLRPRGMHNVYIVRPKK